ncbi:hypothetical protein GCM10025777_16510 [Membranihabitans marinus]
MTGLSYSIGGIMAIPVANGFEYDLSVATLSGLPGSQLPNNYEFSSSDSLYLRTKYVFCKENSADWFEIGPGEYEANNEYENVFIESNFEAIPVGESTPYGCGGGFDEMEFLGSALSVDIVKGGFDNSQSGCDRNFRYLFRVDQNIGGAHSGYTATYDFFPNEFRPLYFPDSIVIYKQDNYDYAGARLVTQQLVNAGQSSETVSIDPKINNESIIVFDIRAIHDAFVMGGHTFEEENVDLFYYIEFDRNCASDRSMVTDLSIAYTSPLCPGDNFVVMKEDLATDNNSDLGNIDFTQSPVIAKVVNEQTCYTLSVRPRGGTLGYTWLEIPSVANLEILSVSENGMELPFVDGIYQLGSHTGNNTRNYEICVKTNTCDNTEFDVIFGWDCLGYPSGQDYEASCTYEPLTFGVEVDDSEAMLDLIEQPGLDPQSSTYPKLCDQLIYSLVVNSSRAGSVFDPQLNVTIPDGFEIDSFELFYPNDGSFANPYAIPVGDLTNVGNVWTVNLFDHPELVHDSIPGVATNQGAAGRQMYIRLYGRTNCDFESGSELFFTLKGNRPCGDPVKGDGFVVASDRLRIDGLYPYAAEPEITLRSEGSLSCNIAEELLIEFVVEGGDFIEFDSTRIFLPAEVALADFNVNCYSPNPDNCPTIERVIPDPDVPGGSIVYLGYPNIAAGGDTIRYSLNILAQGMVECGQIVTVGVEVQNIVVVDGIACGQDVCDQPLTGITGAETVELEIVNPDLSFASFEAFSVDGTPYVSLYGSILVSEGDLLATDEFNIDIYCADNMMDSMGMPVHTIQVTGPAMVGETIDFEASFLNNCDLNNGLVAIVRPVNLCICANAKLHSEVEIEYRTFDLALNKTFQNQGGISYGDTVSFDITIFNQGDVDALTYEVVDSIPPGLAYVADNDAEGWVFDGVDKAYMVIANPLLENTDTTISILLKVLNVDGENAYDNYAEISDDSNEFELEDTDSQPDSTISNDYGAIPDGNTDDEVDGDGKDPNTPNGDDDVAFDEDDHDVARLHVVDFALIKVIDTLASDYPWQFGSLIAFDIIVENQGIVTSDSIRVKDYVPAGFGFNPGLQQNIDEGWTADTTALLTKSLDYGDKDTVTIYLTLQPVDDPSMTSWINYAEIVNAYDVNQVDIAGDDYDSSPGSDSEEERLVHPGEDGDNDFDSEGRDDVGSEDDHDPAGVMFLDLALFKQVDSTETVFPVKYGDLIKFEISVINQDGVMVDSVQVKDYIPEGYSFDFSIAENQNYGWKSDTTAVIQGPINVGDTITTAIYLTLLPNTAPTDRTWVNYAEIDAAWSEGMDIADMDIDSQPGSNSEEEGEVYPGLPGDDDTQSTTPDGIGSEDDHDPAMVEVFDLALKKTTEEEVAYPGLEALFSITIYNQGGIPATNIEITDYVRTGYEFDMSLNQGWSGSGTMITYTIGDTLYPNESIVVPLVLRVTEDLDPDHLINVAEISGAQDTSLMDREDIDGVFDQDPDNDRGGELDSPADDYVDGDGTGSVGDGNPQTDEDNADPAKILPCPPVNCHGSIGLGFGNECEILITPEMLLTNNLLASLRPDLYKVELFYGSGFLIPNNILRPEHVGFEITAKITFLLQACGGGSCETKIKLTKPNSCLISNTLDTTVYCIDPFLQLDPWSAAYPKPDASRPCSSGKATLELGPDWIDSDFDCDNDTAEIIYREWFARTPDGEFCSAYDTIVVMRLPKLLETSFVSHAKETVYCSVNSVVSDQSTQKRFAAWKQPMGIHDYELPYAKLKGLVYELPLQLIERNLNRAIALNLENAYLDCELIRKANGSVVTIRDVVSGIYMADLLNSSSSNRTLYGVIHSIKEHILFPSQIGGYVFYPYIVLELGDRVLSAEGQYEVVENDWFYNGNGNQPYWFAAGWPDVYSSSSLTQFCDGFNTESSDCISVVLPRLTEDGYDMTACDTLCLSEGVHCGISIKKEQSEWTGNCPQSSEVNYTVTQTCWASSEAAELAMANCAQADSEIVSQYEESKGRLRIYLSQYTELHDTIGPIFNFEYPIGQLFESCRSSELSGEYWLLDDIVDAIEAGVQYDLAREAEYCQATIYSSDATDCGAKIYFPDVEIIDNCSGVSQVKASVNVGGSMRAVSMELTATEIKVLDNGDTCKVYTYSHLQNPIYLPFNGCDGEAYEIFYEAADHCWNLSTWSKFVKIRDVSAPTIVMDDELEVVLQNKIAWVSASSIDEGSWDNCNVELTLARRSDWWSDNSFVKACAELNGGNPYSNWVEILNDLGFANNQLLAASAGFGQDENEVNNDYDVTALLSIFNNDSEVAAHYFKEIVWMWEDGLQCGSKVVHGWLFDLAIKIAESCDARDEHHNKLNKEDLQYLFDYLFSRPGYGKELSYLGGGWSQKVPYLCTDVCEAVETEFMAMDVCCNWAKGWLDVNVKDNGSNRVVQSLEDVTISSAAYKSLYFDAFQAAADASNEEALGVVDSIFGSYIIVQQDKNGLYYNLDGSAFSDNDIYFNYNSINCSETTKDTLVSEIGHDGLLDWKTLTTTNISLDTIDGKARNGLIVVNCSAEVRQDLWIDVNECGQGQITRRFFIVNGCDEGSEELALEQVINIQSTCGIRLSMFNLPQDAGSMDNPLCFVDDLTTVNFPDSLGELTLKSGLAEQLFNSIAIGKQVKSFDIVGQTDIKKFEIEWKIADWCAQPKVELTYVQTIIARVGDACIPVDTSLAIVSGRIATQLNSAISDVLLTGKVNGVDQLSTINSNSGNYQFELKSGENLVLIPQKNTDFSEGITTQDLIFIQDFIMNPETSIDDYIKMAADVNNNGVIEVTDMLELRKLVLNPNAILKNNSSWRFINPLSGLELFKDQLSSGSSVVDFVGIKVGDVDLSSDPKSTSRSKDGGLELVLTDQTLLPGDIYTIEVTSSNFESIKGLQYTLQYDDVNVEVLDVQPGRLSIDESNYYNYLPGLMTFSWNAGQDVNIPSNQVLYSLVIQAKNQVELKDVIAIGGSVTEKEAYNGTGQVKDVNLTFHRNMGQYQLYQNFPNPFDGETVIGFELPTSSKAVINVYDVTGKLLKTQEGDYVKGYNEMRFKMNDINSSGILYYQLISGEYRATKQMIKIDQ